LISFSLQLKPGNKIKLRRPCFFDKVGIGSTPLLAQIDKAFTCRSKERIKTKREERDALALCCLLEGRAGFRIRIRISIGSAFLETLDPEPRLIIQLEIQKLKSEIVLFLLF